MNYSQESSSIAIPARTAFIDESGSFGFDFSKEGTERYYVVCAVIVKNDDVGSMEHEIDKLREIYFSGKEMKSSAIGGNDSRRGRILSELSKLNFLVIALIADKKAFFEGGPLSTYKKTFIKFINQQLLDGLYKYYPKLTIIADEHGGNEFQESYANYIEKHMPEKDLFNDYDFSLSDSKESNIIQVSDVIAGSIRRNKENKDSPSALRIIQDKIQLKLDFPQQEKRYYSVKSLRTEFDDIIFTTALKMARDYTHNNRESTTEEIRARVFFLDILLFKILNVGSEYIYSKEIVDRLRELSSHRITSSYLCREVVAPLRDLGIIIASSPKGYKIPDSMKDISTYINQSVTVAGPMLDRIKQCRQTLLLATDMKLDILEDDTLIQYKNYFINQGSK